MVRQDVEHTRRTGMFVQNVRKNINTKPKGEIDKGRVGCRCNSGIRIEAVPLAHEAFAPYESLAVGTDSATKGDPCDPSTR